MNNNQKSNPADVLDTEGQPTQAMGPQKHDKKNINSTMIVETKASPTPASDFVSHCQNIINPTVVVDTKPQPTPASGTQLRDPNSDPKVVVDMKAQPKSAIGPPPHDPKINPAVVEDVKVRSKPTLGLHFHEQKIGPLVADTESQPLGRNLHADINHPHIRITPLHKKITRPLSSKHGFITCICWTIGLIVLLLLIVGATVGIIFLVFRPKIPNYSVDSLSISDLRLNLDLSLYAKFDVKITATNPNKKIGIYYRKGSKLSVWYSNTKLCQGSLPKFYQGHQNTTKLDVALTGQNQYGSTLMAALQEAQQTGRIPLDLKVDVPVNIRLGNLKLRKIRILGTCQLTVDSLSANSFITIKASTCNFGAKL